MTRTKTDHLTALRERIAKSNAQPGYHPSYASLPIVADEPLWAIWLHPPAHEEWLEQYRTATRDLDTAIAETRRHFRASKHAEVSVLPTVPRSETYSCARRLLVALMVAVPLNHPKADEMLDDPGCSAGRDQGREAQRLLRRPEGKPVDRARGRRAQRRSATAVKNLSWMDHDGGWPEWHRCTIEPTSRPLTIGLNPGLATAARDRRGGSPGPRSGGCCVWQGSPCGRS